MRILVTERIADAGLDCLAEAGHEVDVQLQLTPDALVEQVRGASALIVRSATQVTAEVISAGTELVVVGRAGIGLDNVDVDAATRRGVMVVNAPQSNTLSAAEHTMALLLAQARNIPQAHAALTHGRWERSRWEGIELNDKVLGIVGLGRIGKLVAQRALAFGMRLVAYDPYVSSDRARQLNVELVSLEELFTRSDFVTIHVAKTPDTAGLIGKDLLAMAKPGLRIVNVARGGIIDEAALAQAVGDGTVAGAAVDVFDEEPTTDSPLMALEDVVVTPHLGASTREAQDKAGTTIAEQVLLALAGDFVPFAVNLAAEEAAEAVRPFLPLAEQLGAMFGRLVDVLPETLDVEFRGEIGDHDNQITVLAVMKGLITAISDEPATFVNALALARDRGLAVRSIANPTPKHWVNVIILSGAGHTLAGTLSGLEPQPRIVLVDGHTVDLPPARHMVVVHNDDRPGVIGRVGTILGDAGVNINDMDVGVSPEGDGALMVISTAQPVPPGVAADLQAADGIQTVRVLDLPV